MSNPEELTEGNALQPFVQMAKNAKGKACALLIQQALTAPNVFVFGELLEMANVQQLAETEDKNVLELLKIFAYGTYSDYKAFVGLPPLTPAQLKKLRQLSIVSLSAKTRVISYSVLQEQLEIGELRELEDLIIDAIYQGVIQGQLDQKRKQLEIEFAMGRDFKPASIDAMMQVLSSWATQSEALMSTIKDKIQHANYESEAEKKHKEEFEKRVESVKASLKAAMEADLEFIEGTDMYDMDRRKGGRGKSKMHGHPGAQRDRRGMN